MTVYRKSKLLKESLFFNSNKDLNSAAILTPINAFMPYYNNITRFKIKF